MKTAFLFWALSTLVTTGVCQMTSGAAVMADQFTSDFRRVQLQPKARYSFQHGWGAVYTRVREGLLIVWQSSTPNIRGRYEIYARAYSPYNWPIGDAVVICELNYLRIPPKVSGSFDTSLINIVYQMGRGISNTWISLNKEEGITSITPSVCTSDDDFLDVSYFYQFATAGSPDGNLFVTAMTNIFSSYLTTGIDIEIYKNGVTTTLRRVVPEHFELQTQPEVAVLKNGNFVIAWQHSRSLTISGQVFNSDGVPVGYTFQVDAGNEMGGVWFPHIVVKHLTSGFFILWKEDSERANANKDPTPGIWLREFTADGVFDSRNPLPIRIIKARAPVGDGFVPSAVIRQDDSGMAVAYVEGSTMYVDEYSTRHDASFGKFVFGHQTEITWEYGFTNFTRIGLAPLGNTNFGFALCVSFIPNGYVEVYNVYEIGTNQPVAFQ